MKLLLKIIVALVVFMLSSESLSAKSGSAEGLLYPELVDKFYTAINRQLFWFGDGDISDTMRALLLQKLDSSAYIGAGRNKYNYDQLFKLSRERVDSAQLIKTDRIFTDAAISYCKDLYQGSGITAWLEYDEWSAKYAVKDNDLLVNRLSKVRSPNELFALLKSFEPADKEYLAYKMELKVQYEQNNINKAKQVAITLNFYRWMHHFNFEKFILVNIPSATLRYYESNVEVLFSRMIVGKPYKRTPRFDATCRQAILYPYWNVPQDITLRELVPKYKKSPALIDKENMQVLDANGKVIDPYSIKWSHYNNRNFPYRLRQSTGCDNSLGIIKFDLTSPFEVYLHDTNEKELFKSNNRYRSHGCMRVEKAIELGNYLLDNKLDTAFLQACIKGEKPITVPLEKPVPVFVVYLTAVLDDNGMVKYYSDVYHLLHSN